MTGGPHLYAMTIVAEQRHAEFLAQADRDRLGQLTQPKTDRQRWADLFAVLAIVVVLALLLAAGAEVA